jgi:formylglycine-generating enzyme required for sulfatase activity
MPTSCRRARNDARLRLVLISLLSAVLAAGLAVAVEVETSPAAEVAPAPPEPPPGFAYIPAGSFLMGSPEDEPGRSFDEVQHRVVLTRPFFLAVHPVTEAQWHAVMGGTSASRKPKVEVTWFEAVAFCNALSRREGLTPAYEGSGTSWRWNQAADGYRLPTEAEWEYACRAGTTTAFAGGAITDLGCDDPFLDTVGWYCGNSGGERQEVGLKPANPWGLHDMHGNVWEWCWDRWADYQPGRPVDPRGPERGSHRLIRGGSFFDGAPSCRCARRGSFVLPSVQKDDLGFRIARWVD